MAARSGSGNPFFDLFHFTVLICSFRCQQESCTYPWSLSQFCL